jgi:hypothetical protein
MSQIAGYKGRVLTVPFEREGAKAVVKAGFATASHKSTLTGLEVVYGNGDDINPGDVIFVKPDGEKGWGREPLEVDGKVVIVCEPQYIMAVKRAAPSPRTLPKTDKAAATTVTK